MTNAFRFLTAFALFNLLFPAISEAHDFGNSAKQKTLALITVPPKVLNNGALRAVVNQYKLWDAGLALNTCFMGGHTDIRQFIVQTVRAWTNGAYVSFDFGDPPYRNCDASIPSHVRIAFENDGNWAYVGTDALKVQGGFAAASVNIGETSTTPFSLISKPYLRGAILHEFGHVLALEHEHQSSENKCIDKVDWKVVYKEMASTPNFWDTDMVDSNLRPLVGTERLRTTAYDRKSIMHYVFPASWFQQGAQDDCWVARNDDLSPTDVGEVKKAYPATIAEQARYIAQLDSQTNRTVKAMGIPSQTQTVMQDEINRALNDGLKRARVTSNFININQSTNIDVKVDQKSGPCGNNTVIVGSNNQTTSNIKCDPDLTKVKP